MWQQIYSSTRKLKQLSEVFWVAEALSKQDIQFSITFHGFNPMWGYTHFTTPSGMRGEQMFTDMEELLSFLNERTNRLNTK